MTEQNKKHMLILLVSVILQIVLFTYNFAQKNAFLTDEFYTYGLSNSYYKPFLCSEKWHAYPNNVWLTGDEFKYYLRTNKDTAFSFGSVMYNLSQDTTPPVYYIVLHMVSSVFAGSFSWWWAFCINILCFAAAQILLYKIFALYAPGSGLPLYICGFWGFTLSALYAVVYVRMYAMLDMFVLLYIYLLARLLKKQRPSVGELLAVMLTAVFGGLTHYLFFLFAFFYTGLCCLYFIAKKRLAMLFGTSAAALAGVAAAFAAFPAAVKNIFAPAMVWKSSETFIYRFYKIFRLAVNDMLGLSLPYDMPDAAVAAVLAAVALGCAVTAAVYRGRAKAALRRGLDEPGAIIIFISALAYFIYVCHKTAYEQFGIAIDRYIFAVMPLFIGCAAVACRGAAKKAARYKGFIIALLLVSLFVQNFLCFKPYAEHFKSENGRINEWVSNENCIMIEPLEIYLPSYSEMLENADRVFVTSHNNGMFLDEKYALEKEYKKIFEGRDRFYVAVDMLNLNEDNINYGVLPYFSGISGFTPVFCTNEKVQGSEVRLYRFER